MTQLSSYEDNEDNSTTSEHPKLNNSMFQPTQILSNSKNKYVQNESMEISQSSLGMSQQIAQKSPINMNSSMKKKTKKKK